MTYKTLKHLLVFTISILFLSPGVLQAEGNKKAGGNGLSKTTAQTAQTWLDINNISTYFFNNGISDISPAGNSGFVFPKGSGKTAVFTSGLLWGAEVTGFPDPRVGGTAYRTGLVPGAVKPDGTADTPTLDKYRIYRVRADVYPGGPKVDDLASNAANEGVTESALRTAYETDWTEWPADMGAPYEDVDGNGSYDPAKDIPGFVGADQTVWFVANDLNPGQTTFLYGAAPLGLEIQATFWAYNRAGALGNMYFRKYRFINVTNRSALTPITFNKMYVSMWSDVDLGDAGDDFVGVDKSLSLQYCYNANAVDKTYSPLPPPAVGFDFFQGPLVNGQAGQDINENGVDDAVDFGIFNNVKVGPGKINLPMTAAYYFANADANIGDPPQGNIDGSRQFYNFFQGKFGVSGAPFIDLVTGLPTTFALSGDPQKGTGWLDGKQLPAGDRRQGSSSGPFNMAPGDTQEVVVAEIVGGAITGADRLSAIGILKFYDQQAQLAYDNFFDLPTAPPAPKVTVTPLDKEIVLDWGEDAAAVAATETSSGKGFTFEGYNVYQLPTASSTIDAGVRIATYDRINGVGKIEDKFFDAKTGVVATGVLQFGNDTGIKRFLHITQDVLKGGTPLINGIKYYYAVTAYSYNPSLNAVPNNLENPIAVITVVPQTNDPGVTQATTGTKTVTHTGTADATVTMKVVDPAKLTGHQYQVNFNQTLYFRDSDGKWKIQATPKIGNTKFGTKDVSPSSVSFIAQFGKAPGSIDLVGTVDVQAPDFAFVSGVMFTFPAGVTINSGETYDHCANGETLKPVISGQTITWGGDTHSGFGCFSGGDQLTLNVTATLPLTIDYTIYDDDYNNVYNGVDTYKNAVGSTTVTTASFKTQLQDQWSLKDVTTGANVLEHQTVFGGRDLYWDEGGSSNPLLAVGGDIGADANATVDGFQVAVDGSFASPINWLSIDIGNSSETTLREGTTANFKGIIMSNYTVFGGTVTSYAIDNFGFGVPGNDIDNLQQDYELRFTGVRDSVLIGSQKVMTTKDGTGSKGTIFLGLNSGSLPNHPLNPNPGSSAPFLIQIPFEVWNIDQNKQVNLMFRDRLNASTANPFNAWNYSNRMYAIIENSPYDDTTPKTTATGTAATWVLVFWSTQYALNDTVTIKYANPLQPGKDKFTFSTQKSTFNAASAKNDVEKINVFPNPYYGVNSEELNKYNRFVTFNHLPANATIRIFNLAGIQVKSIVKSGGDQFQRWDLANQAGLPVASGLYIAYIDMPDLGTTKILKFAIIQEQQILDRF